VLRHSPSSDKNVFEDTAWCSPEGAALLRAARTAVLKCGGDSAGRSIIASSRHADTVTVKASAAAARARQRAVAYSRGCGTPGGPAEAAQHAGAATEDLVRMVPASSAAAHDGPHGPAAAPGAIPDSRARDPEPYPPSSATSAESPPPPPPPPSAVARCAIPAAAAAANFVAFVPCFVKYWR
jgi:hypothetical protein